MIDFEDGRVSVRLSETTYYVLQQDVAAFCFFNNDGSYNENGFYNVILPLLHLKRTRKRERLRKILEKRFGDKVKPEFKDEIFYELDDVFNLVKFDDKKTKYHQAKIDIRLSKENMQLFSEMFSVLALRKIPKSTYIRSLLNQYTTLRTDEREFLCYSKQYDELMKIIEDEYAVEYYNGVSEEILFPLVIDLCCYNNEFYVIGIVFEAKKVILKSYRLCEFKKYKVHCTDRKIGESFLDKAEEIVSDFLYYEKSEWYLGEKE